MIIINGPNKFPLTIMVIINSILIIPGLLSILFLINEGGTVLALVPLIGIILYFGYIFAIIKSRYHSAFWVFSIIYNFGLFSFSLALMIGSFGSGQPDFTNIFSLLWLIPLWSLYMLIGSAYYFKNSHSTIP